MAWAIFRQPQLQLTGEVKTYASSREGRRQFCPRCGTSLFYTNDAIMPGMIDVQSGTLDDPDALPPTEQVQVAERIGWMANLHQLPAFERYPPDV